LKDRIFCLLAVLRRRGTSEGLLALLPSQSRDAVRRLMEAAEKRPEGDLRDELKQLRETEIAILEDDLTRQVGPTWRALPSRIQDLLSEIALEYGPQDRQEPAGH
jgi:hypothetical protein